MVAAFGDLQITVVTRRQLQVGVLDRCPGHQVEIRRAAHGGGFVHRADDLFVLMRAGDGQHLREASADRVRLAAHAAGDDDAAVLGNRFADRFERLLLGGVEEAAGIDQHHIGAGVIG